MLRTRLFLSLLPFVVILLAMGVYAIALISRLAATLDSTMTENYRSIVAVQAMNLCLAELKADAGNATAMTSVGSKAFAATRNQFEENLALQLKNATLPGEKHLNDQLEAGYLAFRRTVTAPRPVQSPRDQSEAYERAVASSVGQMNTQLGKILDLHYQAILAASQRIGRITRDATRLMIIGMVVVLVLSAYTCYQLSRAILQPIELLTRATRKLGEGNWDQPVPVISRDELGELASAFNNMAAQLQEYRQSTTEEIVRLHRTMETTLASFPDPIFVLNHDGSIELKNPAAGSLVAGLGLDNALPARLQTITRTALDSGQNFLPHSFKEVVSFRIDGTDKFFLPRVLAMRDKADALFGVAVVLYDVTRFRLLDAVKTNLVATVSHELNSPLTSVLMVLHILLERTLGELTPKQDELLQTARGDTERLLRILNDLLDLTRLEEGNAGLRKENVAPSALLQSVIEETADKVSAKGLKINFTANTDLPAVSVDRQRINHVFTNLIANAIKYSPAGSEIVLRAVPAEDSHVEFSVTDQGPGIPEEFHTRIFDRFFRVPGQNKHGAGLGLSIAKEITVAHGGRIGVKSAPGQGSTFFVVLPGASPF